MSWGTPVLLDPVGAGASRSSDRHGEVKLMARN